jgi:hypothetical protein
MCSLIKQVVNAAMQWLLNILFRVLRYLKLYEKVKFGHIDVVGSGGLSVDLDDYRHVLEVKFDDVEHISPPHCGGGLPDVFEWQVHKKPGSKHKYELNVAWSVQRPRRIVWIVSWR